MLSYRRETARRSISFRNNVLTPKSHQKCENYCITNIHFLYTLHIKRLPLFPILAYEWLILTDLNLKQTFKPQSRIDCIPILYCSVQSVAESSYRPSRDVRRLRQTLHSYEVRWTLLQSCLSSCLKLSIKLTIDNEWHQQFLKCLKSHLFHL